MSIDKMHTMHELELTAMLERAAQKGATEALSRIGLQDENAGQDIYALRDMIKVMRQLRSSILNKIVSVIIVTFATFFALGIGKWVLDLRVFGK
jgi:hypothetical protein